MGRVAFDLASTMRFADSDGLREFSLAHRFAHQQIAGAISSAYSVAVPGFDVGDERAHKAWELVMLKPKEIPPQAQELIKDWLLLHQNLHQAEYDALGLGPAYDFSTVDFADANAFQNWMLQHQQAHDIEADALGIT